MKPIIDSSFYSTQWYSINLHYSDRILFARLCICCNKISLNFIHNTEVFYSSHKEHFQTMTKRFNALLLYILLNLNILQIKTWTSTYYRSRPDPTVCNTISTSTIIITIYPYFDLKTRNCFERNVAHSEKKWHIQILQISWFDPSWSRSDIYSPDENINSYT